MSVEKISVSYKDLKELVDLFTGPAYQLLEMHAISSLPDTPVQKLKTQMRHYLEDKNLD